MRLLLDECVPKRLKDDLAGHDVSHVVEMGWSSKRNGELLKLMVAERFDACSRSTSISSSNRMSELRGLALSWCARQGIG